MATVKAVLVTKKCRSFCRPQLPKAVRRLRSSRDVIERRSKRFNSSAVKYKKKTFLTLRHWKFKLKKHYFLFSQHPTLISDQFWLMWGTTTAIIGKFCQKDFFQKKSFGIPYGDRSKDFFWNFTVDSHRNFFGNFL